MTNLLLVDTNILVDVLEDDPKWAEWSLQQLRNQSKVNKIIINPIIYTELSVIFSSIELLDDILNKLNLEIFELPKEALFLAGKAFVKYRKKSGAKSNVLSDFFIGAHVAVLTCLLLTRDRNRYQTYFPTVKLITPT